MAGVHWGMHNRQTEMTAGLISTVKNKQGHDHNSKETDFGYKNVLDMFSDLNKKYLKKTVLHFTCMERDNETYVQDNDSFEVLFKAKDMVYWILNGAKSRNLPI